MKKILFTIALAVLPFLAYSQQLMSVKALPAATATSVLTASAILDNITIINATTNTVTVDFFDSATTSTTMVQAAYTTYASYATNFNVVFTNQNDVLVTNTFSGIYTYPTVVAVATNTRPKMTVVIPASSTLNKDVKAQVMKGLTAMSSDTTTLTLTYRKPY